MATGRSTLNASYELFDISCSPCSKDSRDNEAVKYCVDCQEYLCATCVDSHNRFSVLAGHTLLGRSQFGTESETDGENLPSVPTERCKVHTMKLVDMYCVDHGSVGCHVCFTLNHRQCQDIHYIPEYIQTTPHAEYVQRINDEIKNAISRLEVLVKENQKATYDNNRNKDTCLKEIKTFRTEINQILDRLEQASIAEIDEKYNKLDNTFKEELKHMQEALDRLTKCKTEMESSKTNVSQQFVSTQICKKTISETEKHNTDSGNVNRDSLSFVRESGILTSLQKLDSLGHLQGPQKRSLYKVKDKETYNVKQKDDGNDCNIWSSCIIDTGDMLLADFSNKKIKLVECKTYTVRHSMTMSDKPYSVCRVSATEAAVTLCNKTVQFVSTKEQLVRTRSLNFDHGCRGIDVVDGQLALSENGSKAYIYTMTGKHLKTIEKDKSGNDIFQYIREISVSDNGNKIHVVDSVTGPLTIDKGGNVIWRYSGSELKHGWGVCTESGNIFVSGNESHNVIQIGPDGQYMGEVVPASYGLVQPKAVCFDRKNSKLIVAATNELHVFLVD